MRVLSKTCIQCGNEFTGTNAHGYDSWRRRKYCSQECKVAAQRGKLRAPTLTKSCERCSRKYRNRLASGITIQASQWEKSRFCSRECKYAAQKGMTPHNKGARIDLREQLYRHIDRDDPRGCWNWTARRNAGGYGEITVNRKKTTAHRISYVLHHGPIPEGEGFHGYVVRHKCDNPSCVNPDHLELGTQYQNMQDRKERGREVTPLGSKHGMAKLGDYDVRAIRELAGHYSQKSLAAMFNISVSAISMIVNRKIWKHI